MQSFSNIVFIVEKRYCDSIDLPSTVLRPGCA